MYREYSGIVLHILPLQNSGNIVSILTKEEGVVKLYGRAGGSLESKNAHAFRVGVEGSFQTFTKQENHSLPVIQSVDVINYFERIVADYDSLQIMYYIAETIHKNTEEYMPVPELYTLVSRSLSFLNSTPVTLDWLATYNYHLLKRLGYEINLDTFGKELSSLVFSVETGGFLPYGEKGYNISPNDYDYLIQLQEGVKYTNFNPPSDKLKKLIGHMVAYHCNGPFQSSRAFDNAIKVDWSNKKKVVS